MSSVGDDERTLVGTRPPAGTGTEVDEVELLGRRVDRGPSLTPVAAAAGAERAIGLLRANLRDSSVRFLLGMFVAAQVADLVTTHVALQRAGLAERNPLFRLLFQSLPGLADVVKLGAALLIVLVALATLAVPRSRHAMLFAAAISIVAPIANVITVLGGW